MANLTVELFKTFVGNKFFTVTFTKLDGEERTMNARLHVKAFVKGTQPEATAKRKATNESRNQVGVWEISNPVDNGHVKAGDEKYRTIRLDTITRLAANGQVLFVKNSQ